MNDNLSNNNTGKLNVISDTCSQVVIKCTSTVAGNPAEIGFTRATMNNQLSVAFGVGGDLARGAFWHVGGEDRMNVVCNRGIVLIQSTITTPALYGNDIQGLRAERITIDEVVMITQNVTVSGSITASNSIPFVVAGRFNGSNLNIVASSGRSNFIVARGSDYVAGVYKI